MSLYQLLKENKADQFEDAVESILKEQIAEQFPDLIEAAVMRVNRIRNGKIQRNRRVAADPNYTIRSGRLTRISPIERRRRQLSQRLASRKRRSKIAVALRKRKISLMRRKAFGGVNVKG